MDAKRLHTFFVPHTQKNIITNISDTTMKKRFFSLLGVIIIICIVSCEKKEQEVPVTSVSIIQATAEMIIGETVQLSATVQPSNATDNTITWTSSKQTVATVSNGKVTAVAEGFSTITASCGGKSATCLVTVSKGYVAVSSVALNKTEIVLEKDKTETLIATVNPSDATDQTVTWSSSASSVASVDNRGKVTAVAGGNAVITAKAGDKQATCTVTVIVPVESISLDRESVTLEEEATTTLVATVKPDDATDKSVSWSSSNNEVATVEENGKVIAIKEGEATITAKAGEKTVTCKVIVQKKFIAVTSVTLNKVELALEKGQSEVLVATVKPDNATNKSVYWTSSNEEIASVDQSGIVVAKNGGGATITATSGDCKATCSLSVTVPVQSITLNKETLELEVGGTETLFAAVYPNDATDKTISWSSQNESVASVDQNGKVLGVSQGSSIIIAAHDNIKVNCVVTVVHYDSNIIRFVDAKVKEKLVSAFDTNQDGELSYDEASAVSSAEAIKSAFGNIKTYNSFDEFRYFTGIPQIIPEMFSGWTMLSSIALPEQIQSVGKSAFDNCVKLSTIDIPEGVTSIAESAFSGCINLISIALPSSLTSIGSRAFSRCNNLASITIPEGVSTIDICTFYECGSLSSITIPESVSSCRDGAFFGCNNLNDIYISSLESWLNISFGDSFGTHPFEYNQTGGRLFLSGIEIKNVVIPTSVSKISSYAFYHCSSITSISIPESISKIGAYAFSGCNNLASVIIPESVSTIEEGTFYQCGSLSSVSIPESVSIIGRYAFGFCYSLTSVDIPESVYTIDYGAFQGCSGITTISIPESVTTIGSMAFAESSNLTSVTIPGSVTSFGNYVFEKCSSLTSVVVLNGVSHLGKGAFRNCTSLKSITLPESLISFGEQIFQGCTSLTSIIIPEGVTSIGQYSFDGCTSLTSVTLPKNVSFIGKCAFQFCSSLTSIAIPESITTISSYVFQHCDSLTSIVIPDKVTVIDEGAFRYCGSLTSVTVKAIAVPNGSYAMFGETNCLIYVPSGSVDAYKTAKYWSNYATRIRAIQD